MKVRGLFKISNYTITNWLMRLGYCGHIAPVEIANTNIKQE